MTLFAYHNGKPIHCASHKCEMCEAWFTPLKPRRSTYCSPECAKRGLRSTDLRKRYGINIKDLDALMVAQGGRCYLCRKTPKEAKMKRSFHVDHDHETGKVRGLLCRGCNFIMSRIDGDPSFIDRVIKYALLGKNVVR